MIRDNLLEKEIASILNHNGDVMVFDSIDSTNTYLKGLAADGQKEGTVVIAKSQTKGRGRLGRSFHSAENGLYLSLLLRPNKSAEASLLITVAASVAVALAIEKVTGKHTEIKWVNDIYLNGKKVSGILTEGAINPENAKLSYAVLGIGVNIFPPKDNFPEEIKNIATAIYGSEKGENILPTLAAEIINIFMEFYKNLEQKEYITEYKKRSILTGKEVSYVSGGTIYTGKVLGIDDDARLLLRVGGEKVVLNAGEVSVRLV